MRIALNGRFYAAPVTGVQRFAREVFARLPARVPVTLFLPADARVPQGGEHPAALRGRLAGHAWEQLELPRDARAAGCGAVLNASGTSPLYGGRHVLVIHDLFPLTHPAWFTRRFALWYRLVLRRSARRAAAIVAPSEWTRSEIVRVLGVAPSRIHVVTQGLAPFDAPASPEEVRRVRAALDLPEPYVLAVGAGDRRKNIVFLLRMLARWDALSGDAPTLVVAGARRDRVHGRNGQETPMPASVNVRWLGYVADAELRALYTGARVFCFPSFGEGFGRPPLESIACGTPAVVADYPVAREVLGHAAVILPLELDPWIDAVRGLLEVGRGRSDDGVRGREVAARYDWEAAADGVAEACLAAAAAGRPSVGPRRGS